MLRKPDIASHDAKSILTAGTDAQVQNEKDDPLYGYWFFEAYYEAFAKQLRSISPKFVPTTDAEVEELLSVKTNM